MFFNPIDLYMVQEFKYSISEFLTSKFLEFMQSFPQQAQAEGFVEQLRQIYVFIDFLLHWYTCCWYLLFCPPASWIFGAEKLQTRLRSRTKTQN
jgi:hypothetical protein